MSRVSRKVRISTLVWLASFGFGAITASFAAPTSSEETDERIYIAATNLEDAIVVDCQLPGKLRKLGGTKTYLTPGRLQRLSAISCHTRGGEYTLGDLASGTLSLRRWLPHAEKGDPEAQYYVARIYANGMDDVPVDYGAAATWYRKAAEQGYAEAKQELGYLYEVGLGVEKDELVALNLQREASGLGQNLDYAYKVENAQALVEELTGRLTAANGVLRDTQLRLQMNDEQLSAARATTRSNELRIVTLVADLDAAQKAADRGAPAQTEKLEQQIEEISAQLRDSQESVLVLEQERDAAQAAVATQMLGGQAAQLELRELLARTEVAEQRSESLSAQLAEEQQRLIRAEEEIRELQAAYRDQLETAAAERERLLVARAHTESDAAAYIAVQEAGLATATAQVASLESQLKALEKRLANADTEDQEAELRQTIAAQRDRYETQLAGLRNERDELRKVRTASEQELRALYDESQRRLSEKDNVLEARQREIERLTFESEKFRERVSKMEQQRAAEASRSGQVVEQLRAQLSQARSEAVSTRNAMQGLRTEKSAMESKLLGLRAELRDRIAADNAADAAQIELLQAEIAASESTINAQNLRIAALEKTVDRRDAQLADLRGQLGEPEPVPVAVQNALTVLDMARSPGGQNLGRFHALLIANEKYQNLEPLTTPIKDIYEIEKLLVGRYGFEVDVLTNATEDQILRRLHEYTGSLTSDDNLLIYYAGRGSTPDGPPDRAYWLGVDADPEIRSTWLLAEHVSETIREIDAKRILLLTDSCFSKRRLQPNSLSVGRGLDPKRFELLSKLQARLVLTSGENVPVRDEQGDPTHSLFAKHFLDVLRQNEVVLSGEMLSYEMAHRVRTQLGDAQAATPSYNTLQGSGHKAGDFFFVPTVEPMLVAAAATVGDSG